jgi:hypothetical protein
MKVISLEKIELLRNELANIPEALKALDSINKWEGDLYDAVESIATQNGIEGVQDYAEIRWSDAVLQECRKFICQSKYSHLRNKYVPALIPSLSDFLAGFLGCPPGIASIIATPFAVYIADEGFDKFCESEES